MKYKIISQGREARQKLQEGVNLVADIIKTTLGPKGRNVIVKNLGPLPPRSMNDGYYIADHIQHLDPLVNAGVDMVKEICKKTNDVAGDGTTSTAILCQGLINAGLEQVEQGRNPIDIKRELTDDLGRARETLKALSKPIDTPEEVESVATISGNNDPEIGRALREIYEQVGRNAAIMAEKSGDSAVRTEAIKGIYFDKGFGEARAFVNNPQKLIAEYKDVLVLCVDEKLEYIDDIHAFFEKLIEHYEKKGKSTWEIRILVIANELPVRMDACGILAENNRAALNKARDEKGREMGFYVVGVEAPEFGPTRSEILEDIAIATGGVLVGTQNGLKLKDADPLKVLGRAERVVVTSNTTTIIGGNADPKLLEERIAMLKGETDQLHVNAKITREKLERRLQVISSGVGIIYAGGSTEMESKERHLRIEDAILAVRSALEEGIVAGGGLTYLKLIKSLKSPLMASACRSIARQVAENAGKDPEGIIDTIVKQNEAVGYNAQTDAFCDLMAAGVIDSTKVIRVALENAVSLASLFLTTSSAVIETVEDEKK